MDLSEYQKRAIATSRFGQANSPQTAVAPMLGLAGATGSILDLYKKYYNDELKLRDHREYVHEELGDLLWYVAVVAKTFDLDLNEIAEANLAKTTDRYGTPTLEALRFEGAEVERERFPRRVVVEFRERLVGGQMRASLTLREATPNDFPEGALEVETKDGKKMVGYKVGAQLGDEIDDNSRRVDDYRYHDAIHMGFMTVLGWSPIFRELLAVKRRSLPDVNRVQDGARAKFLEEGLAAVLYRLSMRRARFTDERTIDGDVIAIVQSLVHELEVEKASGSLWRRAINLGFTALHKLGEEHGGYLVANLDERTLEYKRLWP